MIFNSEFVNLKTIGVQKSKICVLFIVQIAW